jgi:hypothetical protein
MKAEALLLLRAIGDRETATGLLGVGDLIEATGLDPEIVVNELERLLRSGYVSGKLQKTFSGGDPRPWFVVNPLLSERGSNVLEQSTIPSSASAVSSASSLPQMTSRRWDAFISHAHEDKAAFVADLARELTARGLRIWYDDDVLEVGDSVRTAIDNGLRDSDFGIVVISKDFMRKDWTNHELDGILALERGKRRLLPVWHDVEQADVAEYSPTVAGRFASRSTDGVPHVADELVRVIRKDVAAVGPGVPEAIAEEVRAHSPASSSDPAPPLAVRSVAAPTPSDHEEQGSLAEQAKRAPMRQRFYDLVPPAVVSVLAAARVIQAAANARVPLSLDQVTALDGPMDLFDLYPETKELATAVAELRHHTVTYRVQVDTLIARSAEMKEAAKLSLRPDLGLVVERLSNAVGERADRVVEAAVAVRAAASRVVAGDDMHVSG